MLADESFEFTGDLRVAPKFEIQLEAPFPTDKAEVLQPPDRGRQPGQIAAVGEGGAAPQRLPFQQELSRLVGIARRPACREQCLEPMSIHLGRRAREPVPTRDPLDRADQSAKFRDVTLEIRRPRIGRSYTPYALEQRVIVDRVADVDNQMSQDAALLETTEVSTFEIATPIPRRTVWPRVFSAREQTQDKEPHSLSIRGVHERWSANIHRVHTQPL